MPVTREKVYDAAYDQFCQLTLRGGSQEELQQLSRDLYHGWLFVDGAHDASHISDRSQAALQAFVDFRGNPHYPFFRTPLSYP